MFSKIIQLFLFVLLCGFGLLSCAPKSATKATSATASGGTITPRADPGYLHYLEKQSLLANASILSKTVSGTDLAWKTSPQNPEKLLDFANTWLRIHPLTFLSSQNSPVFANLDQSVLHDALQSMGIQGLYIAPTNKAGALWAYYRDNISITGEDIVQFAFSDSAGAEKHYHRLMNNLLARKMLMGGDLIPSATGIGPDFFLATRNHRDYPGIYFLKEIPKQLWSELPKAANEWEGVSLSHEQIATLQGKGILPASNYANSKIEPQTSWAVTGEVRGIDAQNRRWLYRTTSHPAFVVMNWDDPSKNAQRIFSASAIQQVGVLGQSLVGLQMHNLQTMESQNPTTHTYSLEPSLGASNALAREVHRYGGWSWLRDENLSLYTMQSFLASNIDYVFDSAFSPAAEHALLTGNANLVRFMADELLRLNIDTARLVHTGVDQDGLSYELPHLVALAEQNNAKALEIYNESLLSAKHISGLQESPPMENGKFYSTGAGIAAMALDINPSDIPSDKGAEVAKGHSLLLLFKAMQAGVFMPSGQDLVGLMPLHYSSMTTNPKEFKIQNLSRGAYALTISDNRLPATLLGMPKAKALYPTLDVQVNLKGSLAKKMENWTFARTKFGIAKGKLIARPKTRGEGSIALIYMMPDQETYLLTICNFGRQSTTENISLEQVPSANRRLGKLAIVAGQTNGTNAGDRSLEVKLGAWQGASFILPLSSVGMKLEDSEANSGNSSANSDNSDGNSGDSTSNENKSAE